MILSCSFEKCICYQLASFENSGLTVPKISLALLHVAVENPDKVAISTPMYMVPYADGYHLINASYKKVGAHFGLAFKRWIIDGVRPDVVRVISRRRQGRIIELKFNVASPPLKFDVSMVTANANMGFGLIDANGDAIGINAPLITQPDTVQIVAIADIPDGASVTIGWSGSGVVGPVVGPRTNLRDSQGDHLKFDVAGENYPVHNWAVIDQIAI